MATGVWILLMVVAVLPLATAQSPVLGERSEIGKKIVQATLTPLQESIMKHIDSHESAMTKILETVALKPGQKFIEIYRNISRMNLTHIKSCYDMEVDGEEWNIFDHPVGESIRFYYRHFTDNFELKEFPNKMRNLFRSFVEIGKYTTGCVLNTRNYQLGLTQLSDYSEEEYNSLLGERASNDMGRRYQSRLEGGSSSSNQNPIRDTNQNRDPIRETSQNREPIRDTNTNRNPIRDINQNRDPIREPTRNREPILDTNTNRNPIRDINQNRNPIREPTINREPIRSPSSNSNRGRPRSEDELPGTQTSDSIPRIDENSRSEIRDRPTLGGNSGSLRLKRQSNGRGNGNGRGQNDEDHPGRGRGRDKENHPGRGNGPNKENHPGRGNGQGNNRRNEEPEERNRNQNRDTNRDREPNRDSNRDREPNRDSSRDRDQSRDTNRDRDRESQDRRPSDRPISNIDNTAEIPDSRSGPGVEVSNECRPRDRSQLPRRFDWRERNVVTPAKYQGSCGSCWAFTALAALESAMLIKGKTRNRNIDLSEQELLACAKDNGCKGGTAVDAYNYMLKNQGVTDENTWPYDRKENCNQRAKGRQVAQIKDYCLRGKYAKVNGRPETLSDQEIQYIVREFGPVYTTMDAKDLSMKNLKRGLYNNKNCKTVTNHAVTIVGWDEEAWIIKNSWGTNWGDQGFFRLKRGENLCGVNTYVMFPIL